MKKTTKSYSFFGMICVIMLTVVFLCGIITTMVSAEDANVANTGTLKFVEKEDATYEVSGIGTFIKSSTTLLPFLVV